jgi:hypothetical protein
MIFKKGHPVEDVARPGQSDNGELDNKERKVIESQLNSPKFEYVTYIAPGVMLECEIIYLFFNPLFSLHYISFDAARKWRCPWRLDTFLLG